MIILKKNGIIAETLSDFLTVQEAASRLGVSASTLRNWDRAGKLKARRHPINGYRLYSAEELEKLLQGVRGKR
ncbi:MAG: helix-turn-helix domain-containing protein [Tepidisphaeraceae bacterium]